MKKISYLLAGLTTMLFCMNTVSAMTINDDGTMTNSRGVTITQEQYKKISKIFASSENKEKKIDYLEQEEIDVYTASDTEIKMQKEYFITTYTLDRYGNVINTRTISASKEDAEKVAENKNLHLMADGTLQDVSKMFSTRGVVNGNSYETASKSLLISYQVSSTGCYASMYVDWLTVPKVKSYDVLAFRGTNFKDNVRSYTAYQLSNADETYYSKDGTNTKISSNGIGVSMNLHDNATLSKESGTAYTLHLWIGGNGTYGDYIYATYQHATSNISLATSQSYTFGSSGLGGVLVYSNGYSKYFDNMNGLKWHYTT